MINKIVKFIFIGLIRFYQRMLSPLHPPVCRFQPTCSEYFVEALQKKGLWLGVFYGIKRLVKCHPLGGKGYDPVD